MSFASLQFFWGGRRLQDNAGGNKYDTSLCVISFNFIKTKQEYKEEIQRTKKGREGEEEMRETEGKVCSSTPTTLHPGKYPSILPHSGNSETTTGSRGHHMAAILRQTTSKTERGTGGGGWEEGQTEGERQREGP